MTADLVDNKISNKQSIAGYHVKKLRNDVIMLQNATELVYIKHVQGFYRSDHNPSICWRGSGYSFQQVQVRCIKDVSVYHAILQKGKEKLYTAWWYDNGSKATISQLSWRWDEIQSGQHYSIVNITAASQPELFTAAGRALSEKTFADIIKR